ncbi:hypothetical protein [Helicobacter bizzozeronii]|uniref:hypothetical protein n=1 Tax=Helicobacter bizzozeronii TaxID=56877 RepID=UPI0025533B40|nr:hypothetical protein [Helicobacter bizzozeronii]
MNRLIIKILVVCAMMLSCSYSQSSPLEFFVTGPYPKPFLIGPNSLPYQILLLDQLPYESVQITSGNNSPITITNIVANNGVKACKVLSDLEVLDEKINAMQIIVKRNEISKDIGQKFLQELQKKNELRPGEVKKVFFTCKRGYRIVKITIETARQGNVTYKLREGSQWIK